MEDEGDTAPRPADRGPAPGDHLDLTDRQNEDPIDATVFAVVAHGLLNSLSVIRGFAGMIDATYEAAPPEKVHAWLSAIEKHGLLMSEILHDLVLGLPDEAAAVLDELSDSARR